MSAPVVAPPTQQTSVVVHQEPAGGLGASCCACGCLITFALPTLAMVFALPGFIFG